MPRGPPGGGERAAPGARLGGIRQRRRPVDVRLVRQGPPEEQAAVHLHGATSRTRSAKLHAGLKPDLFRPYVGWVKYFATERPGAAVEPEADLELQVPEPLHGQGRPVQGQAVRDPGRLGLRRDPLPQRQGPAEGQVVGPALRRALQGQDRLVRRPRDARRSPASTSGSTGPVERRRTTSSSGRRSSSSRRSTSSA